MKKGIFLILFALCLAPKCKATFGTEFFKAYIKSAPKSIFVLTNSVTVTNSNSELTIIGGSGNGLGSTNILANFFKPGKTLVIKASGVTSSPVTPGTLNLKIKLGSTVILTTGAQTSIASSANRIWTMEATITCIEVGSSGKIKGAGRVERIDNTTFATTIWGMVNPPPTETVTVNTSTAQAFDITVQFSIALGSSITLQTLKLEESN